jgi:hypothetical protein
MVYEKYEHFFVVYEIFADKNFLEHTNTGPDSPKRVLLMDGQRSHTTLEFVIRANKANIQRYLYPSHLTHVMQPLDVGVFQPYKHWHKKAIQHAMRNLDIDYNIASFFRDLTEIREYLLLIGEVTDTQVVVAYQGETQLH